MGITGFDTRSLTNFIRDKGAPKGTISYSEKGKFNINKLKNLSNKWNGLKNLDLAEYWITSKAEKVLSEDEEMIIEVNKAKGKKCPRCWKILESKCARCERAIKENI